MKRILLVLVISINMLMGSILDMMNQFRNGLVHRPGCGWGKTEACVWLTGGGSMLDLVMAFREMALRDGIATKIVLGRVSLSEAQVEAWLPWELGETDVQLDDFGGGGNGVLMNDGRFEFDMAWLRCNVHYAPDFGTEKTMEHAGSQWIDVFPALLGCEKAKIIEVPLTMEEVSEWRQEIEAESTCGVVDGKQACTAFPLEQLLEKRQSLVGQWMSATLDLEVCYESQTMPGYTSRRILGTRPVEVLKEYGEYDELPSKYMSEIAVEIVRNDKVVCQLIAPQMDMSTVALTWSQMRDGSELNFEKGMQCAGLKAFPQLSIGERRVGGQAPYVFGEKVVIRFQRRLNGMLLEELTDYLTACEHVTYGLSMGHGECELVIDDLSGGDRMAVWLRTCHDAVRRRVMGLWNCHEEVGLCVSKFVEGVKLSQEDGTVTSGYTGAGDLGVTRLLKNNWNDGWRWVTKAAMNDVSSAFLKSLWSEKIESPWCHVLEMAAAGQTVYAEKDADLSFYTEVFGKEEVVIGNNGYWAGSNSGFWKMVGQTAAWQMAVVEHADLKAFGNVDLPLADGMADDVSVHVLWMLRALEGSDKWLESSMEGRLTALALFCRLEELRAACPRIEILSLENDIFKRGKAIVELKVSNGESWMIQVIDSKGNTVRSYNGDDSSVSVMWDGCNEHGISCDDGSYRFIGSVVNGEFKASRTISGIMDTESPVVQMVAWMEAEDDGNDALYAEYLVEDEHLGNVKTALKEIVSGGVLDSKTLENNHGKLSFVVAGETEGVYEWTVHAVDLAGNEGIATSVVKSGAYSSGDVWSWQMAGKEELKADGVVAELGQPADGAEIDTEIVRVMGTASGGDNVQYMLRLWDVNGCLLSCLAEDREAGWLLKYAQNGVADDNLIYKTPRRHGAVVDGLLGILDVSGLSNGRYRLELVVIGENGTANSLRDIYLEKRLRNGVFEFSETDGAVVIGGMELKLQRSYSSSDLRNGEFGYGWRWNFSADGGEVDDEREIVQDVVGNTVSVRCGGSRDVSLTLPDGRRCTFRFSLEEGGGWSFAYYAVWTAPSNVKATLRPTVSNKLMALPGMQPYWEASGNECDWELFDFPGFVLTDVDGTEYEYMREPLGEAALLGEDGGSSLMECYGDLKLSCIRKRNGECWKLSEQNILHIKSNGETEEILQMERDDFGRVTRLSVHGGNDILYDYDDRGNLCRVVKEKNGEEKLFRVYEYADEQFPHHLTDVLDGRGVHLMAIEYDSLGGYCGLRNADGANASAIRDALYRFELQTDCYGHETLFGFDEKGQMTLKIEADGGRTQFAYDDAGHEVRRTDSLGRSIVQAYDSEGNLTSRTTADGDVTRYYYDGDGRCKKLADAGGRVMEAEYDASGHANKLVTPTGIIMKRRFSSDGLLEADLDENGEELALYEHDASGRRTAVTDYVGGTRQEFFYDVHGKLSRLEQRSFNPETGDVETYGLFYERDDDGNIISMHDSLGEWTQIVRDGSGLVSEKRMSNGLHQRYRYDVAERCVEEVDVARQMVTRTVYDIGGRVVAATEAEPVLLVGGKVPETVYFGTVWLFSYDTVGRLAGRNRHADVAIRLVKTAEDCYCCEIVDDGEIWQEERTEHDLAGQITREVSALGYETRYFYDNNGRCTTTIDHYGHGQRREFDRIGNVVLMVDGTGHETKMEYDEIGRLRKTCFPDGSEWTTIRDKYGNVIEQTDGEGLKTTMEYVFDNRPAKVSLPEINGVTPTYIYGYDSCGSFISMTDPLGRVRRYERDTLGRVVSEISPLGKTKRYQYWGRSGHLSSQTDGNDRRVEWLYDEFGRVVKQSAWGNETDVESESVIESAYDDYGRLADLASGDVHRRFSYDVDGRLVSVMDGESPLWEAAYNAEGALNHLVANGMEIGYARGQHGRLDGMSMLAGGGDELLEPWAIAYGHDADGQVVNAVMSDGWSKKYAYDSCGRCVGMAVKQGDEDVYHVQYTLDRNGRRVAAVEIEGDAERHLNWRYDELGRLVEEHISRSNEMEDRYWLGHYDAVGNLLEEEWRKGGTVTRRREWQVNYNDQVVKMVDMAENSRNETQFEWNGSGELVKMETTGGRRETREWTWSAEGRLQEVSIVTPSRRTTVSFDYDLEGILRHQRVVSLENGREHVVERDFLFETVTRNGLPMLLEMKETRDGNSRLTTYMHGHELEGWMVDGQFFHAWSDAHGGLRGIECNGSIKRYEYDAWGVEAIGHEGFGYVGEWQDEATGLVYLRGRFYWPEIRRFISADRHPADFMKPQTWHRYAYCLDDPVNCRDPQGEFAIGITMGMTLRLLAFYSCIKFVANWYYDIRHMEMMRNMLEIRKRYRENATVVVHGVTEHEVNWSESFSDRIEKLAGNQDMYEFLWSGFQSGGFILFVPNHLSHTIAKSSLVCYLCELYMKGYAEVNVIAHSWGTVLSRDAMNYSGLSFGLWATMGSPLGQTHPLFQYRKWQNYFTLADPVTHLADLLVVMGFENDTLPLFQQLSGVEQHRTLCVNPVTAHSSYWTDPTVFNDLLTFLKWQQ